MIVRLAGQTAFVTGAASGLGRAVVDRFVAEGAGVGAYDRSADHLEALKAAHGDKVATFLGDVRDYAVLDGAIAQTAVEFGGVDVLVANAGIWDFMASLHDTSPDRLDAAFDELFSVNVKGFLLAAKAALPFLVRARGSIIMTLSNAAFDVAGGGALYTASKHAALGLVKQLAFELAPSVRVNAVAPGGIATRLAGPAALDQADHSISDLPLADFLRDGTPLGLLPEARDYAGAYVFLASREDARPATGTVVRIDNGVGVTGFPTPAGGRDLAAHYDEPSNPVDDDD